MTPTWDDLRAVEGLHLGPAAFRYQRCVKCNEEIDTLLDDGMWSHYSGCQVSFRTALTPYNAAVLRALRGL